MKQNTEYLRRSQAADYLQAQYGLFTAQTLAKLACIGGGPVFHKMGRAVLYRATDLDAWAQARMSPALSSTAELGGRS